MLQEVANQEFPLGLCTEQKTKAEGMEHDPGEGMSSMQCESSAIGEWWDESDKEDVGDHEDELEISSPINKLVSEKLLIVTNDPVCKTYRKGSTLWSNTASFRKYRLNISCCDMGDLSRGDTSALPTLVDAKLVDELTLVFLLPVSLWPSFSVPESLSVSGPSVSVALSPSVADGVVEPNDTVDDTEALRIRSSSGLVSPVVLRPATGTNGVRCANSLRCP